MGQAGPGPGGGPSRRAVEVATAVIVAVIVASGVVAVGVMTRDNQQNTAGSGAEDTTSEEPDVPDPETVEPAASSEPAEVDDSADEPTGQFRPEVTEVELSVDQPEYTGPCPVTLAFRGRVTTNTGPLRADVEWRDADSNEVEGERVQFGGPGASAEPVAQGVTITHEVEVADDATIQRTLVAIDPNEVASNPVDATVTCTPFAEITKGGDDFDEAPEAARCHLLHFDATITAPRDMAVSYEWLRLDGTPAPTGVQTVEFSSGGVQTQSIPRQSLTVGDVEREVGYRLHFIEPFDLLSDPVTYEVNGCAEPAV